MIKAGTKKVSAMSSEEEATAANVLSQMSQIQQISCETIEATVINVGHHCDVETSATQGLWNLFVFHSVVRVLLHTRSLIHIVWFQKICIPSLKPWPNGVASRRKLKTWVYMRLCLANAYVHLR